MIRVLNARKFKIRTTPMKSFKIGLCIVAAVAGVIIATLPRATLKDQHSTEWSQLGQFKPGPIRHEALTEKQLERVRYLQSVFREVDPTPIEKWIEDFQRDANPDREIVIWEGMAEPYKLFTTSRDLSLEEKKEAYRVVLMRSGAPDDEVLKHLDLKTLTEQDAKQIMALFTVAPQPIRVAKP
ncbi:MAG: hypothetical protein B7Z47_02270 [Chthoniobacter sp. 12-60-6]|nr:MAG: hypothetical protein B7Z47_02270 [Chthoniobacter sp. 12-60-6]